MPLINVQPVAMQNGDRVTFYSNTVNPQGETYTFLTAQETVIIRNKGSKTISYTIGSQIGTLGPSESVKATGNITVFALTASQGTQAFEVWADETGSEGFNNETVTTLDTRINNVESSLAEKATKVELQNIGNGSPKGVYATLSALQTAFPAGTTGVYVVTADGKWYFWNGSAWTVGGTYQSAGIVGRSIKTVQLGYDSVSANETTFLKETRNNLFNKDTALQGYALDSNGNLMVSGIFVTSDWIVVKPNTTYYMFTTSGCMVALYDSNKNFISLTTYNQNPITTTANTYYVRTQSTLANINNEYFSETNGTTAKYSDYTVEIKDTKLTDHLLKVQYDNKNKIFKGNIWLNEFFESVEIYGLPSEKLLLASDFRNKYSGATTINFAFYGVDGNKAIIDTAWIAFSTSQTTGKATLEASGTLYGKPVTIRVKVNLDKIGIATGIRWIPTYDVSGISDICYKRYTNSLKLKRDTPVVCLIDDDGYNNFLTILEPILSARGKKCSLGIITSQMLDADTNVSSLYMKSSEVKALYESGYDILSHSKTHLNTIWKWGDNNSVTDEQIRTEAVDSYNTLKAMGIDTNTIVYPYGMNKDQFKRVCSEVYQFGVSTDATTMTEEVLDNMNYKRPFVNSTNPLSYYTDLIDKTIASNGWLILGIHSSLPGEWTPELLNGILDYINTKETSGLIEWKTFTEANEMKRNIASFGLFGKKAGSMFIGRNGLIYNA